MRWKKKIKTQPAIGTTRLIKKFAWFPTECYGYSYHNHTWTDFVIWLESYWETQEYVLRKKTINGSHGSVICQVPEWITVKRVYA
jgi:hypothetical protein